MQQDLRETRPDLDIEILGMNPIRLESGNEDISEGRDIPWLQDVDADEDGKTDNWLTSWPYVYRDVVIVDANNEAVDTFNLTIHSLGETESYDSFRQMLIDVAVVAIDATDDAVSVPMDVASDIDVLGNDLGSSRIEIQSISSPSSGMVEIVTSEYPADLDSIAPLIPDLIISEIVPDEYIELYNSKYESVALADATQYLVSGSQAYRVADMDSTASIDPRGYVQLPWPDDLVMDSGSGELVMFRDGDTGFEDFKKIDDFVAWGAEITDSRLDLAVQAGKWYGPPDGTLDEAAIQRIPGTFGDEVHSYDNHRPATPGTAINGAIESRQVARFTPAEGFSGEAMFSYVVVDGNGTTDTAEVSIMVSGDATPWRNAVNPYDINNDGRVSPLDALSIINLLSGGLKGPLPEMVAAPLIPGPFIDCDGSNSVEPLDALLVINALNGRAALSASAVEPAGAVNSVATELRLDAWTDNGNPIDSVGLNPSAELSQDGTVELLPISQARFLNQVDHRQNEEQDQLPTRHHLTAPLVDEIFGDPAAH